MRTIRTITITEEDATIKGDGRVTFTTVDTFPDQNTKESISFNIWLTFYENSADFHYEFLSARLVDGLLDTDRVIHQIPNGISVPRINKLEVDVTEAIDHLCQLFHKGINIGLALEHNSQLKRININIRFSNPWHILKQVVESYNEDSVVQMVVKKLKWKLIDTEFGSKLSDTGFFETIMNFNQYTNTNL